MALLTLTRTGCGDHWPLRSTWMAGLRTPPAGAASESGRTCAEVMMSRPSPTAKPVPLELEARRVRRAPKVPTRTMDG